MNPLPQVSPASQDPLAALRPLHLPEPVGWWPPAPGWWLLGLLLVLALCAAGWWIARMRRRNRYRREALLELRRLHASWTESGDAHRFASAAGSLLRRAALVRFAHAEVAPLCQEQWLAFLDRSGLTLSDQATVTTAMFLTDEGLLRAELVIEDPLALTEPWHVTRHFRRMPPGTKAYDYACAENNRNPITQSGQTLTLDTEGRVIDKVIER